MVTKASFFYVPQNFYFFLITIIVVVKFNGQVSLNYLNSFFFREVPTFDVSFPIVFLSNFDLPGPWP